MNAECAGHEKDKNWGQRSDSVRPQDFWGEVEWEGRLSGLGGWLWRLPRYSSGESAGHWAPAAEGAQTLDFRTCSLREKDKTPTGKVLSLVIFPPPSLLISVGEIHSSELKSLMESCGKCARRRRRRDEKRLGRKNEKDGNKRYEWGEQIRKKGKRGKRT